MRVLLCMMTLGALLAACNTVQGFGQDVKNAGEAISSSSEKTKEKMQR